MLLPTTLTVRTVLLFILLLEIPCKKLQSCYFWGIKEQGQKKTSGKKTLTRYERVTMVIRHRRKFCSLGKKGTGNTVTPLLFLHFCLKLYRRALNSDGLGSTLKSLFSQMSYFFKWHSTLNNWIVTCLNFLTCKTETCCLINVIHLLLYIFA